MMTAPRGSFWTVVGVFILVGSPAGGLAFGLILIAENPPYVLRLGDLIRLPAFALMGFVGGCLPAFLTGVLSAAVSSRIGSRIVWVLFAMAAGASISAMVYGMTGGWVYFGPVGAFAAFVSGLVGLGVRPRWSN